MLQVDELPGATVLTPQGSGALGALPALLIVFGLIGGGMLHLRKQARKQDGRSACGGDRRGDDRDHGDWRPGQRPGKRRVGGGGSGGGGARSDERAPLTPAPPKRGEEGEEDEEGAAADAEYEYDDDGRDHRGESSTAERRPEVTWASELPVAGEDVTWSGGGTELLPTRKDVRTPIRVVGGP